MACKEKPWRKRRRDFAKVGVEGSNPFARSKFLLSILVYPTGRTAYARLCRLLSLVIAPTPATSPARAYRNLPRFGCSQPMHV